MHFTAKEIVQKYNSIFPSTYSEIIKLKGIGTYTAAAIASFSFDLHHVVLDGNVFRVLSRIYDISTPIDSTIGKKDFTDLANMLLPKANSSNFNQAIMEFGALLCVPKSPNCNCCPIQVYCLAFSSKTVSKRPIKEKKNLTKEFPKTFGKTYLIFQI